MAVLHYELLGSDTKEPLIFLHGLLGSVNNWHAVANKLNTSCLLMDLRNHGASFFDDSMDYISMAEDVIETLAYLNIEKCYLAGHSMGGKTALVVAAKAPKLLKKLIVLDIAPVNYPNHNDYYDKMISLLLSFDVKNLTNKGVLLDQLATIYGMRTAQFLLTNLRRDDNNQFFWRVNLKALHANLANITDFPKDIKGFSGPCYWVSGNKTDYLNREMYNSLLAKYPNSHYYELDSGHWLHVDQFEKFCDLIMQILAD